MIRNKTLKKLISFITIWACIITCLFVVSGNGRIRKVKAETGSDHFKVSEYISTLFTQDNGLGSNEVNCVYQSASGYIWVGTDGGLYRYDGNEFKVFNLWDTEKADVYCINDLFQDSQGRLWIATNNYGLFYKKGNEMHHFSSDYYNGIKTINDVCETENGIIFVAASNGLFRVNEDSLVLTPEDYFPDKNIRKITCFNNKVWGIDGGNQLFNISFSGDGASIVRTEKTENFGIEELTCLIAGEDAVYAGSVSGEIIKVTELSNVTKYNITGSDGFPFESNRATGTVGSKGSCVIPVNLEQNVSLLHNFLFDDAAYQVSAQVQQYSNKVSSDTGR